MAFPALNFLNKILTSYVLLVLVSSICGQEAGLYSLYFINHFYIHIFCRIFRNCRKFRSPWRSRYSWSYIQSLWRNKGNYSRQHTCHFLRNFTTLVKNELYLNKLWIKPKFYLLNLSAMNDSISNKIKI